jgi:hypothetical protein
MFIDEVSVVVAGVKEITDEPYPFETPTISVVTTPTSAVRAVIVEDDIEFDTVRLPVQVMLPVAVRLAHDTTLLNTDPSLVKLPLIFIFPAVVMAATPVPLDVSNIHPPVEKLYDRRCVA